MLLSQMKMHLSAAGSLNFKLESGKRVPEYFHVTEVGHVAKHFIDCGGAMRAEEVVSFQLWNANDFEHRLKPKKLLNIISLAERKLVLKNLEIEVEYQSDSIGKYGLDYDGTDFILTSKHTDCLANSACGIPVTVVQNNNLLQKSEGCCTPGNGCC